ncbi:heavy metal translocating P-type ATPase [Metapseudomonas boanensis]|uniref:P-type Zn(2+) transporter n=1 Tax=Metapseudomonas boanensis TaxID=2822138 RepID=A0ABS5XH02_9GAMM|nr:heavy metal translocating P-type ATPase [Pseudomonas boanensis]MBT8766976.1 heavy metal translocating P-type ATPase [Pseudomonas boanensis]
MPKGWLDPALLGFTIIALLAGLGLRWLGHASIPDYLWSGSALVVAAVLAVEIVVRLLRREVGVDLIALISIAGALWLGQALVASVVAVMLASGRTLEYFTSQRAERELQRLINRAPRFAWRLENGDLVQTPIDQVRPGNHILVRMGEVVPVDGTLMSPSATLDESALTGEPIPVTRLAGAALRSGGVNAGSPFELDVSQMAEQSTYAGIVRMAEAARQSRAPFVRLADQYALTLIPLTLLIAGLAWLVSNDPIRALAVVVVATPCPLILAVPIAIMSGISRCAHRGILVKDGATLEALAGAELLFLDKTGTLTTGHATVQSIEHCGELPPEQLLFLAGSLAQASPHPISAAIATAARRDNASLATPTQVEESPGAGLRGQVEGREVMIGTLEFTAPAQRDGAWAASVLRRMDYQACGGSFISVQGTLAGAVLFADRLRVESPQALRRLKQAGIRKVVMLTGDRLETAQMIGLAAGIDEVRAGLRPEEKVAAVQRACAEGKTLMVGDGVNDAPALAAAHVGIALGASGATASSEAAGVVLLVDRLDRVAEALDIAKRSRAIAKQGVLVGMGLSLLAMLVAALGYLPPISGAILQEVIDVAVIFNALRALGAGFGSRSGKMQGARVDQLGAEHDDLASVLEKVSLMATNFARYPAEQARDELGGLVALLEQKLVPHEQNDEAELYPSLIAHLKGEDPLAALSHTHREIFRLVKLLGRMHKDFSVDRTAISQEEIQVTLIRLDTLLHLHFDQEDELYHNLDSR